MNPLKEQIKNLRKVIRVQQQQILDKHETINERDSEIEKLSMLNIGLNQIVESRKYFDIAFAPLDKQILLKEKTGKLYLGEWDSFREIWGSDGRMIDPVEWAHVP